MKEAYNNIKIDEGETFVDSFLKENTKCKILTHWMRKVFTYLVLYIVTQDKFYTKNNNLGTLFSNAMQVYFIEMFTPLKNKLFEAVNQMIKDDRDCTVVARYKIKNLLQIFEEIDMKKPELIKEGDNLYWVGNPTLTVLSEWFNDKFVGFVIIIINLDIRLYSN